MVACSALPKYIELRAICNRPVPLMAAMQPVQLCGEAKCRCVRIREGASTSEETTLTFSTNEWLNISKEVAFAVEDILGIRWLIGSKEPPYPQVSATRSTGSPGGEPAAIQYEVTLKSLRALVRCISA